VQVLVNLKSSELYRTVWPLIKETRAKARGDGASSEWGRMGRTGCLG